MDVFPAAHVPKGNTANAAMAYLAPPYPSNYATAAAFLQAIAGATENLVATVSGYNAIAKAGQQGPLPQIEALRMCLFSSSIYHYPGVSSHTVARTIYAALCGALAKDPAGLQEVQLPVPKDPLYAAVQVDLL